MKVLNMRYYRSRDDLLNLSNENKGISQCILPTSNILLQKGVDAPHKKICNVKSGDFPFPLGESSSSPFFPKKRYQRWIMADHHILLDFI